VTGTVLVSKKMIPTTWDVAAMCSGGQVEGVVVAKRVLQMTVDGAAEDRRMQRCACSRQTWRGVVTDKQLQVGVSGLSGSSKCHVQTTSQELTF
jgi:hypothetical protein